jgi:hypothetical protein
VRLNQASCASSMCTSCALHAHTQRLSRNGLPWQRKVSHAPMTYIEAETGIDTLSRGAPCWGADSRQPFACARRTVGTAAARAALRRRLARCAHEQPEHTAVHAKGASPTCTRWSGSARWRCRCTRRAPARRPSSGAAGTPVNHIRA